MKFLAVYLAYIWVGLLHAFFIGTCLYAWGRSWLAGKAWWIPWGIAFLILAFFETYWIPIFDYFGLVITTSDTEMHQAFHISRQENLVRNLSPRWGNVLFWVLQASIAFGIFRRLSKKKDKILVNYSLLACLLCSACSQTENKQTHTQASSPAQAPIRIQYAQNFAVRYFDTHKEVIVNINANGETKNTKKYALVKRGKPAPKGYTATEIVEIPIRTCVLASHTHIACLQALGLQASLVGLTEASYLPDSALQNLLKQNKIREVGKNGDWQNELLLVLKPDLVMLGGIADEAKLKLPAQSKIVLNADWQETHPLGRAEWLLFMGLFFDVEAKADSIFKKIAQQYETLRKQVNEANLPAQNVILDVPYKGIWYMPAGKSYMATLLHDAHATYKWQTDQKTGSLPLDFEGVFAEARKATYWLNVGICKNIQDITALDSRLATIPALKNRQVYNYHRRAWANGANPYFMQSILEPHLLLADLVQLLHPTFEPTRKHIPYYYKQLE